MIVHENAPVAQGIEQRIPNPCAAGSNPARRTIETSNQTATAAKPLYQRKKHPQSNQANA
jgi:hypothetical protein